MMRMHGGHSSRLHSAASTARQSPLDLSVASSFPSSCALAVEQQPQHGGAQPMQQQQAARFHSSSRPQSARDLALARASNSAALNRYTKKGSNFDLSVLSGCLFYLICLFCSVGNVVCLVWCLAAFCFDSRLAIL